MGEGVGDRALEELLGSDAEGAFRGQARVQSGERFEETRGFLRPGPRGGVVPGVLAVGERQRPVEEIADVREDLPRGPDRGLRLELGEVVRRARTALPPR